MDVLSIGADSRYLEKVERDSLLQEISLKVH